MTLLNIWTAVKFRVGVGVRRATLSFRQHNANRCAALAMMMIQCPWSFVYPLLTAVSVGEVAEEPYTISTPPALIWYILIASHVVLALSTTLTSTAECPPTLGYYIHRSHALIQLDDRIDMSHCHVKAQPFNDASSKAMLGLEAIEASHYSARFHAHAYFPNLCQHAECSKE